MPARRSRTANWRRCLDQLYERGGALEIAVDRSLIDPEATDNIHIIWRVRILALTDSEIVVEQPSALGQDLNLNEGLQLFAVIAIGQNRWMFTTENSGNGLRSAGRDRTVNTMRLTMPTEVKRCQRRSHDRVRTTDIQMPTVDFWPLLDPTSVVVAERANEMGAADDGSAAVDLALPEVGPRMSTTLMNLGGGGLGLRVKPEDRATLSRHRVYWMRFDLPPEVETPGCATGKLVHTHIDSSQFAYAGLAFDFSHNPGHQEFVLNQILRYVEGQQRDNRSQRKAG